MGRNVEQVPRGIVVGLAGAAIEFKTNFRPIRFDWTHFYGWKPQNKWVLNSVNFQSVTLYELPIMGCCCWKMTLLPIKELLVNGFEKSKTPDRNNWFNGINFAKINVSHSANVEVWIVHLLTDGNHWEKAVKISRGEKKDQIWFKLSTW